MKTNDLKVYGKNSRTESIRKPAGFTGPFSNSTREKTGLEIVRRAVESPLRQLADNAGQEGALIVQEVKAPSGN
jgi:chaperonin GroEL (HSP60 family)